MQTLVQLDPNPFIGNATLNNIEEPMKINWIIESAEGNNVVFKSDKGYVTEIIYNGNKYSNDKAQAMRFFFDRVQTDQRLTIRSTDNPDLYYTRTRGYFMMHNYIHDGSTWTIETKGIAPTPFLGNVTLDSIEDPFPINWTIESDGGKNVVLKNGNGYVTEIVYNGNKYSSEKDKSMRFFFDRVPTDQRLVLRSTDNPASYYTRTRGYFMMHKYIHDGSTWTVS